MIAPSVLAAEIERHAGLPTGAGERFTGYGVMGLPFASRACSGHAAVPGLRPSAPPTPRYGIAIQRAAGTSGRTSPHQACSRYFGSALAGTRRARIELDWPGESTLRVAIAEAGFAWNVTMGISAATRMLNAIGALLPTGRGARPLSWR